MNTLDITRLLAIIRECAGEGAEIGDAADVAEVTFADLGYDSLAQLETTARLERDYGVELKEDLVLAATTPARLLELVHNAPVRQA